MSNIFIIEPEGIKGVQDKNSSDEDNEENTFSIKFKDKNEITQIIFVNPENSIGAAIKKYLIQTERAESIYRLSKKNNFMIFTFRGKKIDINDKMKVKEFFDCNDPIIYAIDARDLSGA